MHLFLIDLLTAIPTFVADAAALDLATPEIYKVWTFQWWVVKGVMAMGFVLLLMTGMEAVRQPEGDKERAALKEELGILLALWTLLPPIWFAFEYSFLYQPRGLPGSWETFKHGQDMWAKLWAGVIALLGVRLLALKEGDSGEEKKRKEEISKQLKDLEERLKKLEPN